LPGVRTTSQINPGAVAPAHPRLNDTGQRILGAIDLAIDFATLGEYGLEPLPAPSGRVPDGPCRERPGHTIGWEAFAKARRGDCVTVQRSANGRVRRLHELG
jgi:hypothetical protein